MKVFGLADELVIRTYRHTRAFPREELFGLVSQMRRSAISVAANIVEGCARKGEKDYDRFLDISFASLRELGYYLDLSVRLDHIDQNSASNLIDLKNQTAAALAALIRSRKPS